MKSVGQKRDQVPEHVARTREAVPQQRLRRIRWPGLAIEHLKPWTSAMRNLTGAINSPASEDIHDIGRVARRRSENLPIAACKGYFSCRLWCGLRRG